MAGLEAGAAASAAAEGLRGAARCRRPARPRAPPPRAANARPAHARRPSPAPPCLPRTCSAMPRPWYFLAMDTTRRMLQLTMCSRACARGMGRQRWLVRGAGAVLLGLRLARIRAGTTREQLALKRCPPQGGPAPDWAPSRACPARPTLHPVLRPSRRQPSAPHLQPQGQLLAQLGGAVQLAAQARRLGPLALAGHAAVLGAEALRHSNQGLPLLHEARQPLLLLRGQQRVLANVLQRQEGGGGAGRGEGGGRGGGEGSEEAGQ